MLADLCGSLAALPFPRADEDAHPDRDAVAAARAHVTSAVNSDDFLADCIARELRLIERGWPRAGLVPFHVIPERGIRFAFGYWSPGATPGPHEHTAWTITAVCRNELEVATYDYVESYRRGELVPKNLFLAPAGKTGFIYEPCIHAPRNTSRDWSLSLHISSPLDGAGPGGGPLPGLAVRGPDLAVEHPYIRVVIARQREHQLYQLARILSAMTVARAREVLEDCLELASTTTRQRITGTAPDAPWQLERTGASLVLGTRDDGDAVVLEAQTAHGMVEELRISGVAREAVAYAVRTPAFNVRALPGDLRDHERAEIAEALEATGLFRRVRS